MPFLSAVKGWMFAAALVAALVGGLLLQTWRIDRLKGELSVAKIEIATLKEFQRIATEDAQTQADQCQARVNDARRSAQRIETIIERPVHVDPNGCALRDIVPADELRDALQP